MEQSPTVRKTVIYHRQFGLVLRQTWTTRDHIPPVLLDLLRATVRYAGSYVQHGRSAHPTESSLILQVSAERVYWLRVRSVLPMLVSESFEITNDI